MLSAALSVRSLLLAVFTLMAGAGLMSTLVSVRLERAGVPPMAIGLVGSAYFAGLTIGSLHARRVIRRVGHIRAFSAFVALLSSSTLAYALQSHVAVWGTLRLIDGVCVAGVYVCIESWLADRSEPATRGSILAAYMISLYGGQAVSQFLLSAGERGAPTTFIPASILISLSILPIALTRSRGPAVAEHSGMSPRRLFGVSPLGMVGAGATGVVMGAFYALGAVYAQRIGMDLVQTASFMSAVIVGGVVLQWPLGWLSDRVDRRKVIIAVLAGAAAVAVGLAVAGRPGALLFVLGGLFGGFAFALYPLCVAHANDHVAPELRVGASGALVLVYSAGAAAGPLLGSACLAALGASGLFTFVATVAGLALMFGLWRMTQRPSLPEDHQQPYQALARTTPMLANLDPLAPDNS